MPIPVVVLSEAWIYDNSLPGIAGSNLTVDKYVCLLLVLYAVYVEVSASGRSLVQRISTECGFSKCETSKIRIPSPTTDCIEMGKKRLLERA
jgi:hypothetical protein